jgi:hypothetical protein
MLKLRDLHVETRLIDERFASVMVCDPYPKGASSILKLIRSAKGASSILKLIRSAFD